jgi:hypothetical protein
MENNISEKLFDLNEKDYLKLKQILLGNLDPSLVFEKYHPRLKTIYENRSYHYHCKGEVQNQLSK